MLPRARTVLVVDDQATFRAVARELLEHAGFDVVGEAAGAAQALTAERALRPDVVLLDVRLPDGSGVDVAKAMRSQPEPPGVILTSTDDYRHAVATCGAQGFVPKAMLSGEALRSALASSS
jgi:DNA-binding NarL/FixJ family response regulator